MTLPIRLGFCGQFDLTPEYLHFSQFFIVVLPPASGAGGSRPLEARH